METVVKSERESVIAAMKENQENVRKMVMESYRDMQDGKGRDYKEFFLKWKVGMVMLTYDVIILPLAEYDIVKNTDYIFYEKQASETAIKLLVGFRNTISKLVIP